MKKNITKNLIASTEGPGPDDFSNKSYKRLIASTTLRFRMKITRKTTTPLRQLLENISP